MLTITDLFEKLIGGFTMKKYFALLMIISLIFVFTLTACDQEATPNEDDPGEEQTNTESAYPERPIQLVIPYSPGGATDIIFRIVAEYAQEELGQPIAVVNMAGASATNGSRHVKDADPDGYTLLGSHDVIATAYYSDVVDYHFDAFEPVSLLTTTPNVLTSKADTLYDDAKELMEAGLENPGEIVWSVTVGSTDHFFRMGLLDAADVPQDTFRLAGYDGTGDQITAMLGGHVEVCMTNVTSGGSYVESGDLKFLGVAHDKRLPQIPDTPTLKELDIDFVHGTNRGIFAPKGTPEEILVVLEEAFANVMTNEELVSRIEELGTILNYKNREDYAVFLEDTMELYGNLTALLDE